MKLKMNVVITNAERFLRGDYDFAFGLYSYVPEIKEWIVAGEVEIDINPDTGKLVEIATADIDRKITEMKASIQVAENRKAELLCLPGAE